jgi:hypothetical protein
MKFCYNCGESGHSLSKCPKPIENGNPHALIVDIPGALCLLAVLSLLMWFLCAGGTNFASCFICNQQGHLSKNCPENKHGIYPKVLHDTHAFSILMILRMGMASIMQQ